MHLPSPVGKDVTRLQLGDEVFGIGSFAEYARAREDKLALKPSNDWFRYQGWLRTTGQR